MKNKIGESALKIGIINETGVGKMIIYKLKSLEETILSNLEVIASLWVLNEEGMLTLLRNK